MTISENAWNVMPHLPLERLENNLCRAQSSLKGMALKRVMTLVRLSDGRLVIHSACNLDEDAMAKIEAWGTPSILLVPNRFHRLDAPAWAARYPDLQVLCPKGGRQRVEEVVRVDGNYDDFSGDESVSLAYLAGTRKSEGVMTVRSVSGSTLVFNDALFNMPHGRGVPGFIFRHITASTGGPKVSRLFRTLAVKDKQAFAAHLGRLADTPDLVRLIVSHHRVIDQDPAAVLRGVAATL